MRIRNGWDWRRYVEWKEIVVDFDGVVFEPRSMIRITNLMIDNIRQNNWTGKYRESISTTTYHCIHGSSCPEADESSLYAILLNSS